MDKTEAFKIVLDELKKCPLFCGQYDALHGIEDFMFGIESVMEAIAAQISDEAAEAMEKEFCLNMDLSEQKAREKYEARYSNVFLSKLYFGG